MRNIEKNIEQGREILQARPQMDLSYYELLEIMKLAKERPEDELWNAISYAYKMGVAVGMRNGKRKS